MKAACSPKSKTRSPISKGFFPGLSYVEGTSLLHRVHPGVKLMLLISFSICAMLMTSVAGGMLLLAILICAYGAAGLGWNFFIRKLRWILLFGLMMLLAQILWVRTGALLWHFQGRFFSFEVWSEGLLGGMAMVFRFINVIGSSYLFVAITNPNQLAYTLMQAGLPYRAGFMLITALRFIPLFHLELNQIKNAQMAKGIDLEGLSPAKLVRSIRYLMVPLVISVLGRVDTLTVSMEIRAFGLTDHREYRETLLMSKAEKRGMAVIPLVFGIIWAALR